MDMNDSGMATIKQVRKFLAASKGWKFKVTLRKDKYKWLENIIAKFKYYSCKRKAKGLLLRYMELVTGFSKAHIDRLVSRKLLNGEIKALWGKRNKFTVFYTREDLELLIETDNYHERLSGPATKEIFERQFTQFHDGRYVRLKGISVSHIYNLREKPQYKAKALTVAKTKAVQVSIGIRRLPEPNGKPGYVRVDTVHQGDFNGQKGVYHVNLVDSVLQWEIVICVEAINEDYMAEALEEALNGFPFVILSFHSDNGSEFINKLVADMLNKQLIKQTKSRSGRTNDNALVEGKNGSVIRKHMGHWYIDRRHAGEIHRFYMDYFNIYLNYHRPCGFATVTEDEKGRRKREYNTYRTPYARLKVTVTGGS